MIAVEDASGYQGRADREWAPTSVEELAAVAPGADSSKWFARSAGNGVDAAVCLVGGAHGAVRLGAGMASGFWRGTTRAPDAIHWLVRSNRLSFDARVRILRE